MRTVTRGRTLATLALAAPIVAACSSGAASPAAGAASPAASAAASSGASPAAAGGIGPLEDAVTVRFGVFPNITHAPGLVALADDGPLKKLLPNADIQVTPFNSGTPAVEAILSRRHRHHVHRPQPGHQRVREDQRRGGPRHLRLDLGRRVPRRQARDHQRGRPQGQEDRHPVARQHPGRRAPRLAQGAGPVDRHRRRRRRLGRAAGERPDARDVPGRDDRRCVGARAVGDAARSRTAAPRSSSTSATCGPTASTSRPTCWSPRSSSRPTPRSSSGSCWPTSQAVDEVNDDPAAAQATVNAEIEKFTTKKLGPELLSRPPGSNLTFTVDPIASSLQKSADRRRGARAARGPGRPVQALRPDAAQRAPPVARASRRSRGCDGRTADRGEPAADRRPPLLPPGRRGPGGGRPDRPRDQGVRERR